jgi:hypothetical protein
VARRQQRPRPAAAALYALLRGVSGPGARSAGVGGLEGKIHRLGQKMGRDFRPLIGIPVKLLGQLADSGPLPVDFRLEKPEIQVPNCRCISCRISIEFGRRWGCECTPATPTGLPRSSTAGISTRPHGEIHRVDPDFGSTLTASSRDYQSNCWVNWKIMGQPCGFQVLRSAWGEVGRALQSDLERGRTALLRAL